MYGYGYGFDFTYLGIIILSMVLGTITQNYIKSTYAKWSRVPASFRGTGADVARAMLNDGGASNVGIVPIAGTLTDNYDPRDNNLHLSQANIAGGSVASVAVACHEAGHAIQMARGYAPFKLRSALVPAVNIASQTWMLAFLAGAALNMMGLIQLAVILFGVSVIFQLVTLPVEFDASRRAVEYLSAHGQGIDQKGAKEVLTAAALTYVAAALVSVLQFLFLRDRSRR